MTLWNALRGLLSRSETSSRRTRPDGRRPRSRRLAIETLEYRVCLSTTLDTLALAQTLPQLTLDGAAKMVKAELLRRYLDAPEERATGLYDALLDLAVSGHWDSLQDDLENELQRREMAMRERAS